MLHVCHGNVTVILTKLEEVAKGTLLHTSLLNSRDYLMNNLSQYYFAYGSNLNLNDFNQWCVQHNFSRARLIPRGTALLPDYRFGFLAQISESWRRCTER